MGAICEHFRFMHDSAMENVERNRNETNREEYERRQLLINGQLNKSAEIHSTVFE